MACNVAPAQQDIPLARLCMRPIRIEANTESKDRRYPELPVEMGKPRSTARNDTSTGKPHLGAQWHRAAQAVASQSRSCVHRRSASQGARLIRVLLVVLGLSAARANASEVPPAGTLVHPTQPGLTVGVGGQLLLEGKPYRGIGVNYYSLFSGLLADPSSTAYISGLRQLESHHIPFARFMATGFWPNDLNLLQKNPSKYWGLMRDVVRQAQKDHVGLIPDFFWNSSTVPDLVGEARDQWGNPNSKTIRFMRSYVSQFMKRFAHSPAIWGYEFGNEYNLAADLPNWRSHGAPISPARGTPAVRTAADRLTSAELAVAYKTFAAEVRKYDPYRIIDSGNSVDRISAWHQRYRHSWGIDSKHEYTQMLRSLNPAPMDMTSVHWYAGRRPLPPFQSGHAYLRFLNHIARRNHQPLFIGEFGVPAPAAAAAASAAKQAFQSLLRSVIASGAPLAALWVYDYPKSPAWNTSFNNPRAYQLLEVERADEALTQPLGLKKTESDTPTP